VHKVPATGVATPPLSRAARGRFDGGTGTTGRISQDLQPKKESVASMMNRVKGPGRWEDVQVGEAVELSRNGLQAYAGLVDDRTADGEVVWVSTPVGGRRLFHISDGYDLAAAGS
jgi:hypothetical protein